MYEWGGWKSVLNRVRILVVKCMVIVLEFVLVDFWIGQKVDQGLGIFIVCVIFFKGLRDMYYENFIIMEWFLV